MTVLEDLQRNRADIAEAEDVLNKHKSERDRLVSAARDERIGYAEIRDATGMSISWINASLVRTEGYRPRAGRPRRRSA